MKQAASLILLAAAACEPAPQKTTWLCGEAFAIKVRPGDVLSSRSPVEDFLTHTIASGKEIIFVYEGNHPNPNDKADLIHKTGSEWPAYVAIYDKRSSQSKARDKLKDRVSFGMNKLGLPREAPCLPR